ncbi:unnamed protein product [Amoebophrya sp. A120]|nr:unnamed protein product [Amoebophrya sp. A120]|eukprot:GSA120T00013615001.1
MDFCRCFLRTSSTSNSWFWRFCTGQNDDSFLQEERPIPLEHAWNKTKEGHGAENTFDPDHPLRRYGFLSYSALPVAVTPSKKVLSSSSSSSTTSSRRNKFETHLRGPKLKSGKVYFIVSERELVAVELELYVNGLRFSSYVEGEAGAAQDSDNQQKIQELLFSPFMIIRNCRFEEQEGMHNFDTLFTKLLRDQNGSASGVRPSSGDLDYKIFKLSWFGLDVKYYFAVCTNALEGVDARSTTLAGGAQTQLVPTSTTTTHDQVNPPSDLEAATQLQSDIEMFSSKNSNRTMFAASVASQFSSLVGAATAVGPAAGALANVSNSSSASSSAAATPATGAPSSPSKLHKASTTALDIPQNLFKTSTSLKSQKTAEQCRQEWVVAISKCVKKVTQSLYPNGLQGGSFLKAVARTTMGVGSAAPAPVGRSKDPFEEQLPDLLLLSGFLVYQYPSRRDLVSTLYCELHAQETTTVNESGDKDETAGTKSTTASSTSPSGNKLDEEKKRLKSKAKLVLYQNDLDVVVSASSQMLNSNTSSTSSSSAKLLEIPITEDTPFYEKIGVNCTTFCVDNTHHFAARSEQEKKLWLRVIGNLKIKVANKAPTPDAEEVKAFRESIVEYMGMNGILFNNSNSSASSFRNTTTLQSDPLLTRVTDRQPREFFGFNPAADRRRLQQGGPVSTATTTSGTGASGADHEERTKLPSVGGIVMGRAGPSSIQEPHPPRTAASKTSM